MIARINPKIEGSFMDYPSKNGCCISIYFYGCEHFCKNCQNSNLQNHSDGVEVNLNQLINNIEIKAQGWRTDKIVLLGGDPLYPDNRKFVQELAERLYYDYDVCIYTGYDLEDIRKLNLKYKYLKCGNYQEQFKQNSLKTDEFFQLASKNQKIYDEDYNLLSIDGRMYFKEQNIG